MRNLADDNIYACGTARKDRRGFPPSLKTAKLKNRSVTIVCVHVCMYMHVCVCACMCACA